MGGIGVDEIFRMQWRWPQSFAAMLVWGPCECLPLPGLVCAERIMAGGQVIGAACILLCLKVVCFKKCREPPGVLVVLDTVREAKNPEK